MTKTPLMRVWGSILNPARDLGVFRPAYSTVSLVKTFRSDPFSQEMHVHCRAPHDPLPAQHQLLVPQEALRREYGAQFWTQRVISGSEYPPCVCVWSMRASSWLVPGRKGPFRHLLLRVGAPAGTTLTTLSQPANIFSTIYKASSFCSLVVLVEGFHLR